LSSKAFIVRAVAWLTASFQFSALKRLVARALLRHQCPRDRRGASPSRWPPVRRMNRLWRLACSAACPTCRMGGGR